MLLLISKQQPANKALLKMLSVMVATLKGKPVFTSIANIIMAQIIHQMLKAILNLASDKILLAKRCLV
jgi:hypothetical protein